MQSIHLCFARSHYALHGLRSGSKFLKSQSKRLLGLASALQLQRAQNMPFSRISPLVANQNSAAASGIFSATSEAVSWSCSIRALLVVSVRTARTFRAPYFS